MPTVRGFTLLETMITAGILVSGLLAVAAMFSYVVNINVTNQQMTAGTLLVSDKMEYLRSLPLTHSALAVGGDLTTPQTNYSDYVTIASDGTLTASTSSPTSTYLRVWHISGTNPRTLTVVVYAQWSGLTRGRLEMARATTMITDRF